MAEKILRLRPAALSRRFELALHDRRKAGTRLYAIARQAQLSPSTLSSILHGAQSIHFGDARVIRVGAVLGLPAKACFSRVRTATSRAA